MILGTYGKPLMHIPEIVIGRLSSAPVPLEDRSDHVLLCGADVTDVSGYAGVLSAEPLVEFLGVPAVHTVRVDHLSDGDIVSFDSRGYVRTLYRRESRHNWIFATDRCNSLCLMCSQPPKDVDETGIVERHLRLVRLIDRSTQELGISGGEPTLLGEGLIRIIRECRDTLPLTALHLLSNGRLFADAAYARMLGQVRHPDLMIGIPLYSDVAAQHDYVVQARGAFGETLRGIRNLAQSGVPVEIRVVVHRATYSRLPQLAEFLYRNLTFVAHTVFMGLEITGFTIPNLEELWIDPAEYIPELREATLFLAKRGMQVWIYNHQLCVLPKDLWRFAKKSISDWKNEFLPECDKCGVKNECGGFFASAVQRNRLSRAIRAMSVL